MGYRLEPHFSEKKNGAEGGYKRCDMYCQHPPLFVSEIECCAKSRYHTGANDFLNRSFLTNNLTIRDF